MRTRKKATRFPHSKIPVAKKLGRHSHNKILPTTLKRSNSVKHPRAFSGFDLWHKNIKQLDVEKQKKEMLALIYTRMHDRVCKVCPDSGYDGKCYSLDPIGCALSRFLPEIVEAITRVDSAYLQDYFDSVRERVCAQCPNQDDYQKCDVRDKANCGLDSYLALVVDIVEDVLREAK